jgi:glycosyltransferase involved in cell wall biosynthesis
MKIFSDKDLSISVCMASFNGELFIKEQLISICSQLKSEDEIIIFDDNSSDKTREIIESINDSRIRLYLKSTQRGEVSSFSKAIENAKNNLIFLSDQDDIWKPIKISKTIEAFNLSRCNLITSNFQWIDQEGTEIDIFYDGVSKNSSKNYLKNVIDIFIGKTNYFGCAMAFHKDLKDLILPIPNYVESHDLWIALAGNIYKSNLHLNEKLFLKRFHSNNTTSTVSNRPFYRKAYSRLIFLLSINVLYIRLLKQYFYKIL